METIEKTKRQPTEWMEIFANNIFDRGLISNMYQKPILFKLKIQMKKWADNLNRHFSKKKKKFSLPAET